MGDVGSFVSLFRRSKNDNGGRCYYSTFFLFWHGLRGLRCFERNGGRCYLLTLFGTDFTDFTGFGLNRQGAKYAKGFFCFSGSG